MVGIAFRGVEQLPEEQRPHRSLLMQWYMATERIKALNADLDRKALAVANRFLADGFSGVILKGQGIAQLYRVGRIENCDPEGCSKLVDENDNVTPSASLVPLKEGTMQESAGQYTKHYTLHSTQDNLTQNSRNSQNGKSLRSCCLPDGNTKHNTLHTTPYTLHSTQEQYLSSYRTPGDIDIWLFAGRDKVLDYVRRHVPDCKPVYHHVDFPVVEGLDIEVHFTPTWMNSPVTNRRLQRFFKGYGLEVKGDRLKVIGHGLEGDTTHYTLNTKQEYTVLPVSSLAFNRVYILVHIYRHLFAEGIGLRQLLDYYFVLCQGFTEEERKMTMYTLRTLKMKRFAAAVMWVLQQVFGMDDRYLLTTPDEQEGRFLLSEVMLAGNFGQYDERLQHMSGESRLHWGLRKVKRNFRFVSSYPSEVLWSPFFKLWQYLTVCR